MPLLTMKQLDQTMNRVENALSMAAVIPLGAGGIKVTLGTIQLVVAAASAIFTGIHAHLTGNYAGWNHSVNHMIHGAGNILKGTIESIPTAALLLNFSLFVQLRNTSIVDILDGVDGKVLRYEDDPLSTLRRLSSMYNTMIAQAGSQRRGLTPVDHASLAQVVYPRAAAAFAASLRP